MTDRSLSFASIFTSLSIASLLLAFLFLKNLEAKSVDVPIQDVLKDEKQIPSDDQPIAFTTVALMPPPAFSRPAGTLPSPLPALKPIKSLPKESQLPLGLMPLKVVSNPQLSKKALPLSFSEKTSAPPMKEQAGLSVHEQKIKSETTAVPQLKKGIKTTDAVSNTPKTQISLKDNKTAKEGRVLLQIMEHGSGPEIEIAWPSDQQASATLYEFFSSCYGMRSVLMTRDGQLFTEMGSAGSSWAINLDRYSSFIRTAQGAVPKNELATLRKVKNHHKTLKDTAPTRVFRRAIDAQLLSGLHRILGQKYTEAKQITANYRMRDRGVEVYDLRVDNVSQKGAVFLAPLVSGCRAERQSS